VLTLTLPLTLPLTEYAGFSPAYIYGRRSLPSKKDFKDFDFMGLAPQNALFGASGRFFILRRLKKI
jgi:hypothetical protein